MSLQGLDAGHNPEQALEDEVREQLAAGTLNSVLSTLDSREANILRLRFGLNSERRELPRAEVAAAYGLTGERIRQIEEAALVKLAKPWRRKFLERASEDLL
jgi:RNA polymerase primary sigma factor